MAFWQRSIAVAAIGPAHRSLRRSAQTMTNRVWAHFFDYGFTRPIDDLGPNTRPAQAQLVDGLATEFAAARASI